MFTIRASREVPAPAHVAYAQWMRFAELPSIMADVQHVRPMSDGFIAFVGAQDTWTVRIVDNAHGRSLAWRTVQGPRHDLHLRFVETADDRCRVEARAEYDQADWTAPGAGLALRDEADAMLARLAQKAEAVPPRPSQRDALP